MKNKTSDKKNSLFEKLPELQTITLSFGKLAFRDQGVGEVLLFLHGMNGDSRTWVYQFAELSKFYRVIAWDAPGYCGSDVCGISPENYAHAAFDLLEHLNVNNVTIVGHSMGGIVAQYIAKNYSRILKRLVLSCTHWGWGIPKNEKLIPRYANRIQELSDLSSVEYGALRAIKMVPPGTPDEVLSFLAKISSDTRSDALQYAGRMIQEADNRFFFPDIEVPVSLLYAENDTVIKMEKTEVMLKYFPNAQVRKLEGVGHAPYVEDPNLYNSVIIDCMNS